MLYVRLHLVADATAREDSMFAEKTGKLPILYQCQACERTFWSKDLVYHCPQCSSADKRNLVILHMDEDAEQSEWLSLLDLTAGD